MVDNIIIHSNNGDKTTSGLKRRIVFGLLFSKISNIESKYHEKNTSNNPRNHQTQHTTIQPIQLPVLRPPCWILEPLVEQSLTPPYSPNIFWKSHQSIKKSKGLLNSMQKTGLGVILLHRLPLDG